MSRCPNADEPVGVHTCKDCEEPILEGENFAEIDGDYYCERCIDEMPRKKIIKLCGWEWKTAVASGY